MNKTTGSAAGYVLVATFLFGFTSCGGGGASGASGSPSTAVSDSTEYSSGSLGIFLSNGNATVAAPTATSSGSVGSSSTVTSSTTAYLITLPNAQNSAPSYTPISCSGAAIGGINLDTQHLVGVAFDTTSYTLEFFTFTGGSNLSVSGCTPVPLSGSSSQIVTSAGQTSVGGVVMDPSIQTAIVETGSGFQFVDYSNPSSPKLSSSYHLISPYSTASPSGFDLVENFAYDPYLVVGGVSYRMILSGSGAVSYYKGYSDGNLLELADIETGKIYRPDASTQSVFSRGRNDLCTADAIGIDTAYQVAIIGCEYDAFSTASLPSVFSPVTILINLNALALNASLGTYSLPLSAVVSVTLNNSAPPQNNIFVDSINHIVMWGSGGDWGTPGANNFSVAKLSDPFTSFGSGIVGSAATLSSLKSGWVGYGYPHGSAMYVDSSGNSVALWMNQAANSLAMVKANEILAGVSPSTAVTYVTIP